MRGAGALLALVCAAAAAPVPAATSDTATPADRTPSFLTYTRPPSHQALVTNGIRVPLRDAGHLSCDLYRPGTSTGRPAAGRFPGVVYQYHGYGMNRVRSDPPQLRFLAERGYNALQCSVRGSGGSPGRMDILGPQEARDGYDIVEWLAHRPWSNGRIGMVGYSFGAITTYLTAAQRPPHLRTIVPQSSFEDAYRDIVHLGGVRGADVRGWLLALLAGLNSVGTPVQQLVAIEQEGLRLDREWGDHLLRDSYWRRHAIDFGAIRRSGIPVLAMGGWYDIYQRGMPAAYQRLPEQTWLVMDDVSHVDTGPTFFGSASGPTLAWLDRRLKRRRSAPRPPARVLSHEMPAADSRGWTRFAAWPSRRVRPRPLHLNSGGTLARGAARAASTTYPVNPFDGMPSYWNVGDRPDTAPVIAWNTAREAARVHFTTRPLRRDLVVAGSVRARIKAAFSATDGYLVVRLSDVAPDGSVNLVATGWLQASLSPDYERRVPVTPGQPRFYDVRIWPSHWRFRAGHRLQVSISSGDVPRIHPDAPLGDVTIHTGEKGSRITVPVVR